MKKIEKLEQNNIELKKGQYISADEVERISGINRTTENAQYQFWKMAAIHDLEKAGFVAKSEGDGIRILTEGEADEHLFNKALGYLSKFNYSAKRHSVLNLNEMDQHNRDQHLHRARVLEMYKGKIKEGNVLIKPVMNETKKIAKI